MKITLWNSEVDVEDYDEYFCENEIEDEDEKWELALQFRELELDDLRDNFKAIHPANDIVCIGDLGLWDGRRKGVKCIGDCADKIIDFNEDGCIDIYCDDEDFSITLAHHDGVNYYTYRVLEDITFDDLVEQVGSKDFDAYVKEHTKSFRPLVASLYGWV